MTPLITAFATLAGMIFVTAKMDWQLALVALGVSPVLFLWIILFGNRLRDHWERVKGLDSAAFSVVQEVLSSVRVVKAFGREDHEESRFVQRSSRQVRSQVRLAFLQGSFELLVGITIAVGTAVTLWLGVSHVKTGVLTLGELLMVIAYLAQLYEPLKTVARTSTDLQSSLASAGRALSLLDELPDVAERPGARRLARARGAVTFQDVAFAYQQGRPVLREISFSVEPGSRVGIYGTTGAGKTSLANLLNRFYDPDAGGILLDGVDLKAYRLADLRRSVRHRLAGLGAFFHHYCREHRLCETRRPPRRNRCRSSGGQRARFHLRVAARLQDAGRRARDESVRRRTAARCARPSIL